MFDAGIGIGMLTYATAEPLYHFGTNPDVIQGLAEGSAADMETRAMQLQASASLHSSLP